VSERRPPDLASDLPPFFPGEKGAPAGPPVRLNTSYFISCFTTTHKYFPRLRDLGPKAAGRGSETAERHTERRSAAVPRYATGAALRLALRYAWRCVTLLALRGPGPTAKMDAFWEADGERR